MGYEFEIQYCPGIEDKAASALSWIPSPIKVTALTFPQTLDVQLTETQVEGDPLLSKLKRELWDNLEAHPRYSVE